MNSRPLLSVALLCLFSGVLQGGEIVRLGLADFASPPSAGAYRWRDVNGTIYAESYRNTYTYEQAAVLVEYESRGDTLRGHLTATNLKPNFAYQIKLEAEPDAAITDALGGAGRWWREQWDARLEAWVSGWNLNSKGTGYSPTPNDSDYETQRGIASASSPTGLAFRFTAYLVFDYFVTDPNGDASIDFELRSSYHVLWKSGQSHARGADDGPEISVTVTGPAGSPAYGTSGADPVETTVFGEWERLPAGGIRLPAGTYNVALQLNEESFHETGLSYGGFWAGAVRAPITFHIGTPPRFTRHPRSTLAAPGAAVTFSVELQDPADSLLQWYHNGQTLSGATESTLTLARVDPSGEGVYECVATGPAGSVRSDAAFLLVRDVVSRQEHEQLLADKDTIIREQRQAIGSMYTAAEVARALAEARPDEDGDGYTRTQELQRGTDPESYRLEISYGWNLLSLARVPEDNRIAAIFGAQADRVLAAYRWSRCEAYVPVESLTAETGTWIYWTGRAASIPILLPENE